MRLLISGGSAVAQKILIKEDDTAFIAPDVSPNGKYIALTSKGYTGLWIVRSDGYDLKRVSDLRGSGYIKRWSPDSKWLLFRETTRENNQVKQHMKVVEVYTKNVSRINSPVKKFEDVRWYADDKLYLLSEGKALYIRSGIIVKRNSKKNLPAVYTDSNKMYLERADRDTADSIDPILGANYLDPVLSPDGSKIAFQVVAGNLQVYELDNFQLHDLGRGERQRWSPDSDRIIYQITTDDGERVTSSDIYLIDYDGTDKKQITNTRYVHEMRPSFFPDGKRIIYDTDLLGEIRTMGVPLK